MSNVQFNQICNIVKKALNNNIDKKGVLISDKIQLISGDTGGFCTQWIRQYSVLPEFVYVISIPSRFNSQKIGYLVKLAILHEIGHIIFNELAMDQIVGGGNKLNQWLDQIFRHRLFTKIQFIWYWNRFIRGIKMKLGYSFDIKYSPDDLVCNGFANRKVNELFCDWFAIKEKIWK